MSKQYLVSITEDGINRSFYIAPYDVETYIMNGFSLLTVKKTVVNVDESFLLQLEKDISNAIIKEYWAEKDGVSFPIQTFRIPSFSNRGYTIFTKSIVPIEDPWKEIEEKNTSTAVE